MEKNRIRPVKVGNGVRMSYAHQGEVLEMPNLIEVQTNSYQWFLDDGLKEVFRDISPISDFGGHLSLEFVDFKLCRDESKYDIDQCKERDATYSAPLKVKVRLHNKETEEIKSNYKIMFTPKKSSRHSTVREDPLFEEFVLYLRLLRPLIRRALSQDRAWRDNRGSRFGSTRSVPFSTLWRLQR